MFIQVESVALTSTCPLTSAELTPHYMSGECRLVGAFQWLTVTRIFSPPVDNPQKRSIINYFEKLDMMLLYQLRVGTILSHPGVTYSESLYAKQTWDLYSAALSMPPDTQLVTATLMGLGARGWLRSLLCRNPWLAKELLFQKRFYQQT